MCYKQSRKAQARWLLRSLTQWREKMWTKMTLLLLSSAVWGVSPQWSFSRESLKDFTILGMVPPVPVVDPLQWTSLNTICPSCRLVAFSFIYSGCTNIHSPWTFFHVTRCCSLLSAESTVRHTNVELKLIWRPVTSGTEQLCCKSRRSLLLSLNESPHGSVLTVTMSHCHCCLEITVFL